MKKLIFKCFLLSLFACISFFTIDKVYAIDDGSSTWFVSNPVVTVNGTFINNNYYRSFNAGNLNFSSTATLNVNSSSDGDIIPSYLYERLSLCMDTYVNTGTPGNNSLNTYFQQTMIPCSYPGTDYSGGHITFVTNRVGVKIAGSVISFSLNHEFSTNAGTGFSLSLVGYEWSSLPFPTYSIEDTMIKQNDSILSKLDTIINSNGDISYKLDEANKNSEEIKESIQDTNDTIKDSDTSEASDSAGSFFEGFSTDTHGLTSIITAPLELIGNITSSSCSPISLDIPFLDGQTLSLPCMSAIYEDFFGDFFDVYQIITFGIVAYWICVRIFNLVKDFKNPDHDEVEVMDL